MAGSAIGAIGLLPGLIGAGQQLFGDQPDFAQTMGQYAQSIPAYNPPALYLPSPAAQQSPIDQYGSVLQHYANNATRNLPNSNPYADLIPSYNLAAQRIYNNPYGPQAEQGANTVASMGTPIGQGQIAAGGNLMHLAAQGLPYGSRILEAGFDPQNAYYNRAAQRLSDQTLAGLARTGISSSPYGGSVLGQTMSDFNLDWQDRALNRMNAGIQGYGNLGSSIGRGYAGGADLQNAGLGTIQTSSALPYNLYKGQGQDMLNAFNQMAQFGMGAYQLPQQYMQNLTGLANLQNQQLNLGGGFAANAFNSGLGAANFGLNAGNQAFNQDQTMGANFGQNIAGITRGLGNIFGGGNTFNPLSNSFGTGFGNQGMGFGAAGAAGQLLGF